MGDIMTWLQGYWYEAGSLTLQLAILAAIVWYGRKAVNAIWAIWVAQAQNGIHAETGINDASVERTSAARDRRREHAPRPRVNVFGAIAGALKGIVHWLQEPAGSARRRHVMQS